MRNNLRHEPIDPEKRSKPAPGLYIVATPIGNLGDVTLRALELLGSVDVIACEDTRITKRLLAKYEVATPLTLYHEHNAVRATPRLLQRLQGGAAVALVSDAGTPLISDPGFRTCATGSRGRNSGVRCAWSKCADSRTCSLRPTLRPGFFSPVSCRHAQPLAARPWQTSQNYGQVSFSSNLRRRLARSLLDMQAVLGRREAAVARELTKRYEEVVRGSLDELVDRYATTPTPKGEVVVIVGPPITEVNDEANEASLDGQLTIALATMSVRDAARSVSIATGLPRREAYRRALILSNTEPT